MHLLTPLLLCFLGIAEEFEYVEKESLAADVKPMQGESTLMLAHLPGLRQAQGAGDARAILNTLMEGGIGFNIIEMRHALDARPPTSDSTICNAPI